MNLNGGTERIVKKEDYGDAWPFKVDGGVVKKENKAIIFEVDGFKFGLNSNAMVQDYKNINTILGNVCNLEKTSETINDMINIGLEL